MTQSQRSTASAFEYDVVLIGAGIMSATLAALLTELDPGLRIRIVEKLDGIAQESSDAWNNAGTGHSALCELNYTSRRADGSVDISKAVDINEQFQLSRQFWAALVERDHLGSPEEFINSVPHMSFISGTDGADYLAARQKALTSNPLFSKQEFSDDPSQIAEWAPLLVAGREPGQRIAATFSPDGTDVDFGELSRKLLAYASHVGAELAFNVAVTGLARRAGGGWAVTTRNQRTGVEDVCSAATVFVGAGGGALRLLQKSGIPEAALYGGFPISGEFLRCDDPEVVGRHRAKVYGQAAVGAPPMSVPHLDARIIGGKRSLMFGPYAGFSPKFLKNGSWWDLPGSVRPSNLGPMLAVARDNFGLEKYLVTELLRSASSQFAALREYYPEADKAQWRMITAGQRVQVIKRKKGKGGVLQFGTEVVTSADGSIAGLLGASPGASTAVPIMLAVAKRCFADRMDEWAPKIAQLVPSYGTRLSDDPDRAHATMARTAEVLGI